MKAELSALYTVRHGQTDYNVACNATGQVDCPINATGIAQAQGLRDALRGLFTDDDRPTQIIHSGLARARQTAEIPNEALELPMWVANVFQELQYGDWQGQNFETVTALHHQYTEGPPGEDF